jgi:hypothetical protein
MFSTHVIGGSALAIYPVTGDPLPNAYPGLRHAPWPTGTDGNADLLSVTPPRAR